MPAERTGHPSSFDRVEASMCANPALTRGVPARCASSLFRIQEWPHHRRRPRRQTEPGGKVDQALRALALLEKRIEVDPPREATGRGMRLASRWIAAWTSATRGAKPSCHALRASTSARMRGSSSLQKRELLVEVVPDHLRHGMLASTSAYQLRLMRASGPRAENQASSKSGRWRRLAGRHERRRYRSRGS